MTFMLPSLISFMGSYLCALRLGKALHGDEPSGMEMLSRDERSGMEM